MKAGISVVICCFNSGRKIIPTLEHLAKQTVPPGNDWEIILVDNCCTDNTVQLATQTWEKINPKSSVSLRILAERKPGLSYARKTGIENAKYNLVCLCDDDNWLHANYLSTAINIMGSNPDIGTLGGRGIAVADHAIPIWFWDIQENYACGPQAEQSGDITEKKWSWGAGMILRTDYMKRLYKAGFYHINQDRKGSSLSSGGDTEICHWHIITGKKLWYDERLEFSHYISADRLNKDVAEKLMEEHEVSYQALHPYFVLIYDNPHKSTNRLLVFLKALRAIAKGEDAKFMFVLLQPIFDSRLNPVTRHILKAKEKFLTLQ